MPAYDPAERPPSRNESDIVTCLLPLIDCMCVIGRDQPLKKKTEIITIKKNQNHLYEYGLHVRGWQGSAA